MAAEHQHRHAAASDGAIDPVSLRITSSIAPTTKAGPSWAQARPKRPSQLLKLAARIERGSEHPLASAIVEAARERKLELSAVDGFYAPTGKGVTGNVEGKRIALGNARFLAELNIDTNAFAAEAERLRGDGATALFIAVDGKPAGVIAVADPIKVTTPHALSALAGMRVVMLTGDNRTTAQAVARRLGIAEVEAEVLPDQKSVVVEKLRHEDRVVAMAGDGVNDAPALAAADVGIAMGTGADVAIESAGVTLLKGDLTGIVRARQLSAAVMRNIRQNLFFAFVYNALGVPVAAFLPGIRYLAVADHCGSRNGAFLGQRHCRLRAVRLEVPGRGSTNRPRDI